MTKFIKKVTALLAECGLTAPVGFIDPTETKLIDGKLSLKFAAYSKARPFN